MAIRFSIALDTVALLRGDAPCSLASCVASESTGSIAAGPEPASAKRAPSPKTKRRGNGISKHRLTLSEMTMQQMRQMYAPISCRLAGIPKLGVGTVRTSLVVA